MGDQDKLSARLGAPQVSAAPDKSEAPFGASIHQTRHVFPPANEQADSFLSRITIDQSVPSYVALASGAVIYVNAKYEDLAAKCTNDWLAPGRVIREGAPAGPALQEILDSVALQRVTLRQEERITAGGRDRIFIGRHIPIWRGEAEDGDLIGVVGSYEDVTRQAHKLAEASVAKARFEDYIRASADWYYECDAEMRIIELSDRFTAAVGQPAKMFIGCHLQQIGRFGANLDGRGDIDDRIKARKPFREQHFETENTSGELVRFHLSGVPVFERGTGEFRGYRGSGMDVTERYAHRERANAAQDELEKLLKELTLKNMELDEARGRAQSALRAKNEFLATMSHELRTPLNAIIGFGQSLRDETFGPIAPRYSDFARQIVGSGEHLLALINDILDVAVIEAGGLALTSSSVALMDVVEQACDMIRSSALDKGLDVSGLKVRTQCQIQVDRRRATQVLVNLLSNAVKFTAGGRAIGLEVSESSEAGVEVTVWDEGIGIAVADQERIFDKFQQVTEHIYTRTQEGTGLGLHISRQLARSMGGELTVESAPNAGSRFTVTFPRVASDMDDQDLFI